MVTTPYAPPASQNDSTAVRQELAELLKRVPDKVNNGGHGTAVEYKKAAGEAHKLLTSPRATLLKLTQSRNSLLSYQ